MREAYFRGIDYQDGGLLNAPLPSVRVGGNWEAFKSDPLILFIIEVETC